MSAAVSKRTILGGAVLVAVVVLAVAFGMQSLRGDGGGPLDGDLAEQIPPEAFVSAVATEWADAWVANDGAAMQALAVAPAPDLVDKVASFRDGLRITALRASPRTPSLLYDTATVSLDVAADIQGLGTWTFATQLRLTLPVDAPTPADWKVVWTRDALHPALTGERRLSVTRTFPPRAALLAADGSPLAGGLVGRVGTAEADSDERLVGDPVGTSGLQAAFDADLGGTASGDVAVTEGGVVVDVLAHIDGRAPAPVMTSIDPVVQGRAEAQLAALLVDAPVDPAAPPPPEGQEPTKIAPAAAIVAIRPSTGEVLAAASTPTNGFNRALNGQYPPGSTFKVITSTALLTSGITPDTPTTCPATTDINGRTFSNAEEEQLGDISFRTAFSHSCNTAFIQLASQLEAADLVAAAQRFGFNAPPALEVPAEQSSFPEPGGIVDQVSAAIGQGRVLATPLQMASVAATIASGTHRPTTLRHVDVAPAGEPLPAGVAATLQELMRLVVSEGTGTAAALPGTPVGGKTGTAEYGTADPPRTHAWFIGFRGDLAVAVVVEDGGFGGRVAAPVAREVLRLVA